MSLIKRCSVIIHAQFVIVSLTLKPENMMRKLFLVAMIVFFPMLSQAQERRNPFNQHHDDSAFWHEVDGQLCQQNDDIDRGIDVNELTQREVRKLNREQQHISRQLRHYRRHDYLSRTDKREIMQHLDYMSEKVWQLRHNNHYVRAERHNHFNRNAFVLKNNKHRKSSVGFYLSF